MAILKFNETNIKPVALGVTGLFLCLAAVYFIPEVNIRHKIAFPVAMLALAALWICPWQIFAAMLLSSLGDLLGSCGMLIGQMGAFAAAHICLIWFFAVRYRQKVERDRKLSGRAKGYLGMMAFCAAALLVISFCMIVPAAPAGVIRIGTGIYSCLICFMLVMAMLQRSSLYALGGLFFVFSDFILAWNLFVEPISNDGLMIMIPYFIAQWLLFIRSTSFRVAPEMRILRF